MFTHTLNSINKEDNYLLSIKDRAGNESHISVTIHTHNFVDGVCTICGEGLSPANELEKWDYTLDDAAKKVTLNKYTGTDEDVTVYSNYDVGGECYKTKIKSNDENSYNNYMFAECSNVKSIVFQKRIDTSKVNMYNMYNMFYNCSSLTSLDLSSFDISNAKRINGMFYGCKSLTSLDLSSFDTSNVEKMNNMFRYCSSLTSIIGLSNFDTSNATDMSGMFEGCSSLSSLDLSNFDTSKVTNMFGMFNNCTNLAAIYVANGKWIINENCSTTNMFRNCGVNEVTYKDAT